jgi:transcriptional repressor NrdR
LRQKIRVALTKRPVGEQEIDRLVQKIEGEMLALGTPEVPSSAIGEAVLRNLKELDQVAYIRFASVYRSFADIEDLSREVEGLRDARPDVMTGETS